MIDCEHTCMTMRGIRKVGARTVTSAVRGTSQSDIRTRNGAMKLLRRTAA
jgi:GTP cyclohydrolase I